MSHYRAVPVVKLNGKVPKITGSPGRLIDVRLDSLVVDGRYQRVFQAKNEARVQALAAGWDWACYHPIMVAAAETKLAVIDGTHRAAAAMICGFKTLPAWLNQIDETAQAQAFIAMNATTTRVHALQLWHSKFHAGHPDAIDLMAICEKAGVEIARYPMQAKDRGPAITLSATTISDLCGSFSEKVIVRTLTVLRMAGELGGESLLLTQIIRVVAKLMKTEWHDRSLDEIARRLAAIDFPRTIARARARAKDLGIKPVDCLTTMIQDDLEERAAA